MPAINYKAEWATNVEAGLKHMSGITPKRTTIRRVNARIVPGKMLYHFRLDEQAAWWPMGRWHGVVEGSWLILSERADAAAG